jgi:hypothetical protein
VLPSTEYPVEPVSTYFELVETEPWECILHGETHFW